MICGPLSNQLDRLSERGKLLTELWLAYRHKQNQQYGFAMKCEAFLNGLRVAIIFEQDFLDKHCGHLHKCTIKTCFIDGNLVLGK